MKFLDENKKPSNSLLTLVLALSLPIEKAKSMAKLLLSLGATSAQADLKCVTAFQSYVEKNAESLLQVLLDHDKTGSKSAIDHATFQDNWNTAQAPLQIAVRDRNIAVVMKLLENGAVPEIEFETW